ncbi:hypothetical protein LU290_07285 [Moraxella nasibovis]|uniref:hypothetical protein n=1 Tax=Moraxella nasibovis TaxID=2904120 RepID=UPI0024109F72|nr:hypothetical protein [Moraxella nasibovis]WFF38062.1 hypothetical protein LU290_07285 [Moraxella nasibovis]
MKPKGYLHIIIASVFIFYMFVEIKGFYQSKPHNYRDRQHLLETEFPRLMNQIVYDLTKPDRQWQIDRQGGAVVLMYYYYNPTEHTMQKIHQNIKNNQWILTEQDVNRALYCKEDIALSFGTNITSENVPYVYVDLSWQSRHSECKYRH